ncbi:MAG: metallophosphoesterase [Lachnospiraceae bacterium]|nr:metallophosphoesterase [Lachnospiraceae bacterium]
MKKRKLFKTEEYTFKSEKIAKRKLFVFLSDLHGAVYGHNNDALKAAIRRVKPDAVLIGGDMVIARDAFFRIPNWEKAAIDLVSDLAKDNKVYYCNGNHESVIRKYRNQAVWLNFSEALIDSGVEFINNKSVEFDEVIISGFEPLEEVKHFNIPRAYFKNTKYLPKMDELDNRLGIARNDRYNLLLAHKPEFIKEYSIWGADLVLSGHNHGGVVKLFNKGLVGASMKLFPEYTDGVYTRNNTKMIVSRGLGSHTLDIRINNPAELSVIELLPVF